jgi:hypothetical protein
MKNQKLQSVLFKGCIAAFIAACFAVNVQAVPSYQEPQQKMSKMSDHKMSGKKKDKMSDGKMSDQKMSKMPHGKMPKDTTHKM